MAHIRTKLIVAGVVLATALGYLAFAGVKKGWVYYVEVDQFLAELDQHRGQRVRLTGVPAAEGFTANPGLLSARFTLEGKTQRLAVAYRGAIPDMFKPGAKVVVEGRLDDAGVFQADVLLTKCASKYDDAKPANHPGG